MKNKQWREIRITNPEESLGTVAYNAAQELFMYNNEAAWEESAKAVARRLYEVCAVTARECVRDQGNAVDYHGVLLSVLTALRKSSE